MDRNRWKRERIHAEALVTQADSLRLRAQDAVAHAQITQEEARAVVDWACTLLAKIHAEAGRTPTEPARSGRRHARDRAA